VNSGFFRLRARSAARVVLGVSCALWAPSLGCKGRHEASAAAPAVAVANQPSPKSRAKPELTKRPEPRAPLEQFVQQHVEEGDAKGVRVLVYVGATWCEPCQRFHKALESGELDEALAGTNFLEFDADRDRAELRAAGYASKYIPLFTVPDPAGHASALHLEGSIKGDSAVRENLVPRLLALLDGKTPS
jgi:thiol:disulfide interchange protein